MTKRVQRWHLFGLYGLSIDADDWSAAPLFGDATLVPADFTKLQTDRATADWMVGLIPHRDRIDISKIPFCDQLAQPKPTCFIGVKRQHDPKRADEEKGSAIARAKEIAALLTISRSHYSLDIDGFMEVTNLDRSAILGIVKHPVVDADSGNILATEDRFFCARWLRTPDATSSAAMAKALTDGVFLQTTPKVRWHLQRKDAFVDLMIRGKRTPSEQRIAHAAVHLYGAHYGVSAEQRLAQSITSLEMLFGSDFKLLEARLRGLLMIDDESHPAISQLMKDRHSFVHDGKTVPDVAGNAAIGIGAQAMFRTAEAVAQYRDLDSLWARLDLIGAVRDNKSLDAKQRSDLLGSLGPIAPDTRDRWLAFRKAG